MKSVERIKEEIEIIKYKITNMGKKQAKLTKDATKNITNHAGDPGYVAILANAWERDSEFYSAKTNEYINELYLLEWVLEDNEK